MAESISEPMQRSAVRTPDGTRPVQGSVTAHGTLAVYEPGSGKLVGEVRVSTAAQVRDAAAASRAAQKVWGARSFKERGQALSRFQQLVLDRADELADLIVRENGKGDIGAELIKSGVNMVVFTGSVATGRKVNLAAAEQMIPCVLELGGKDPAIVLPDADLDTAALKLAWGAFANSGQTCASVERVYVHESIAPQLTDKLVKLAEGLRQGEPNSYDVDVGAMTTQMQVDIVKRHLEDARAKGAKVLAGGEVKVYPDGGRFVQPTVLTGVTHDMAMMRDETFGPMLPIMTFRTEEEAVRLANDSPYGLSADAFTRDKGKADLIANQLLAGTGTHNDTLCT